jgi:hypothetical protein
MYITLFTFVNNNDDDDDDDDDDESINILKCLTTAENKL